MRPLVVLIALSLLCVSTKEAFCQRRAPINQGGAPNAGRLLPDQAVMELLRKMIRPTVEYAGTRETILYGATQQTSEQTVKGDAKGHLRIDFLSPPFVAGDVMLLSPGEFHSYHKRNNLLETASWPTERSDQEQRIFARIRQGNISARKTGEEQIAGHSAAIIELSQRNTGAVQAKYWIDPETGIQLQIERYNQQGVLISHTRMKTLVIGPDAHVSPQDFAPTFPGANRVPLFPGDAAPFRTLGEAQGRLPFRPLEPGTLPPGFRLDGVWIFGQVKQGSVLMRYTDGVASFSLFERLAPLKTPVNPLPRSFEHNQQRWFKGSPDGTLLIQFIGHLPAAQAEALYNSLR